MKRLVVSILLAISLLAPVSAGISVAYAQGPGISLVSQQASDITDTVRGTTSPAGVVFRATAETASSANITQIKLQMRVKGSNRSSYTYLNFTPASKVEGTYTLSTTGASYKPAGTLIEYNFVITDSEKRTLETPNETHLYLDNRFQWNHLSEGSLDVYYYGQAKDTATIVAKAGAQALQKMGALLGSTSNETVRILVYNSASDLIPAQPFESQTSERELLLEGVTLPEYGVFLMIGSLDRPDGVASHEMTHVVVGELLKNAYVDVPAWFNEGLAENGNVNRDATFDNMLAQAIAQKKLLPLRTLQNPPGVTADRLLMYGEGYSAVKFLINTYGEDKLRQLFIAFNQGQRIDQAMQTVYGFDQDGLDNAWRKSLGQPPVEPAAPAASTPTASTPASNTPASNGAGIGTGTIVAVVGVGVIAIGLLVFLLSRRGSGGGSSGQ